MTFRRRTRLPFASLSVVAALAALAAMVPVTEPAPRNTPVPVAARRPAAGLPMRFEENRGQHEEHARFVARQRGVDLVLSDEGGTLALPHDAVTLKVSDGRKVTPQASEPLETKSNYLVGKDRSKWRTGIANYGRVVYAGVLDGVDLVYHGEEGQLEYDFVVAPGASATAIAVDVEGAAGLSLTREGDLAIETAHGTLVQRRPRVYQRDAAGLEHDVAASYRLVGAKRIGFEVAAYDRQRDLVIDPVLSYSSYFGGSSDEGAADVAVDMAGNTYLVGATASTNFPSKGPFQATKKAGTDAFVAKLNKAGSALVYATYVGGDGDDAAKGVAVNAAGEAYVVGSTDSSDFPLQSAAQSTTSGAGDAFALKLATSGSVLVYSTYLGGSGVDTALDVAVDTDGSAYVTGSTASSDFPTAGTPLQAASGGGASDAFLVKLAASGARTFATYLGGSGEDIGNGVAVDATGSAYVTGRTGSTDFPTESPLQAASAGGEDAFVARVAAAGSALVFATYLGGSGDDAARAITLDSGGSAYVAGSTASTDFPTQGAPPQPNSGGGTDAFAAKLSTAGTGLVYSTYLGGSGNDIATGIAVSPGGTAYVVGSTTSTNLPVMNPFQATLGGGTDAFLTRLNIAGSARVFSTYLGGAGDDSASAVALDSKDIAQVAGTTNSASFPKQDAFTATKVGGADAFLSKLGHPPLVLTPGTVRVVPNGTQQFTATGGTGIGYFFDVQNNTSGASIVPATGLYTAGPTVGAVDTIRVTDSLGVMTTSTVTVDPAGVGAPDAGPEGGAEGGLEPPPRVGATPPLLEIQTIDDGCSLAAGAMPRASFTGLFGVALGALVCAARRLRREKRSARES